MDPATQRQTAFGIRSPSWRTLGLALLPFLVLGCLVRASFRPQSSGPVDTDFSLTAHYPYQLTGFADPAREIAFYQQRVKKDPTDGSSTASLARLYLRQARLTNDPAYFMLAEQAAHTSLEHQPFKNDNATLVVARVEEAKHDFHTALTRAQGVLKHTRQEDAVLVEVNCYLGLGRVSDAATAVNDLVDLAGNTSTYAMQALVREDQGDDRGVLDCIHRSLSHEEPGDMYGSAWARTMFGRYFFRHGRYALARDFYHEALRIYPQLPVSLTQLAEMETAVGEYDSAEQHYGDAYNVAPAATDLIGKARIRGLRGDDRTAADLQSKAEAMLRKDLSSSPLGHGRDLACLLLTRHHDDDVAQAVAILEKDVRNRRDWLTLDAYAWSLQASHQEKRALDVEEEALSSGIHSAQLLFRKSELEDSLGLHEAALQDRALALQYNPNFRAAHQAVPFML